MSVTARHRTAHGHTTTGSLTHAAWLTGVLVDVRMMDTTSSTSSDSVCVLQVCVAPQFRHMSAGSGGGEGRLTNLEVVLQRLGEGLEEGVHVHEQHQHDGERGKLPRLPYAGNRQQPTADRQQQARECGWLPSETSKHAIQARGRTANWYMMTSQRMMTPRRPSVTTCGKQGSKCREASSAPNQHETVHGKITR